MRFLNSIKVFIDNQYFYAILYKAVLDITYVICEKPYFGYLGIECNFYALRWIISWIIYVTVFKIIKSDENKIINLFSYIMFFLSMTPFLTLYQFSSNCLLWMVIIQMSALVFIDVIVKKFNSRTKPFRMYMYNYKDSKVRLCGWIFLLALFLYLIAKYGLPNLSLLGLENIYQVRAAANISTFDSILMVWGGKIICPLYSAICWKEKKHLKFCYCLLLQVYMYSISGFKTFLFIPLILIVFEFFEKKDLKKLIITGLTGVLILVDILAKFFGKLMPYALIGDRTVFFPAIIKWAFFDYFSNHPYVYFSQNSISRVLGITGPYDKNVFNIIGAEYFDKPKMWTNTGIFADAYSNLGIVGVFLISFLLALVLIALSKTVDSYLKNGKSAIIAICMIYFISFNDGAFLYSMISGGFIIVVLISYIVDFSDKYDYIE